jgi:hypothetical protein
MRVLVAAPAKVGNVWVEALLGALYGLEVVDDVPPTPDDLVAFAAAGRFPDNAVLHQHFQASDRLIADAKSIDCCIVTPIRDPYDTFVSLYHYIQRFQELFAGDPGAKLIGRPLRHRRVLEYLRVDFGSRLDMGVGWVQRADVGQTVLVRYEDLHQAPRETLAGLTEALGRAVSQQRIDAAIEACSPERMRRQSREKALHIRAATVGDGRAQLNRRHLKVFREHHAARVLALGYELL